MPQTELYYLTYERSYRVPNPPSRNKEKNVEEFFRFSLAVIAVENDDECQKTELFYLTYERSYGVPNPPSRKKKKKKRKRKKIFLKNVFGIAIENDDGCRKQNFSISPGPTSGFTVYQTLFFFFFFFFFFFLYFFFFFFFFFSNLFVLVWRLTNYVFTNLPWGPQIHIHVAL